MGPLVLLRSILELINPILVTWSSLLVDAADIMCIQDDEKLADSVPNRRQAII
jgi:hypothetical protein